MRAEEGVAGNSDGVSVSLLEQGEEEGHELVACARTVSPVEGAVHREELSNVRHWTVLGKDRGPFRQPRTSEGVRS